MMNFRENGNLVLYDNHTFGQMTALTTYLFSRKKFILGFKYKKHCDSKYTRVSIKLLW